MEAQQLASRDVGGFSDPYVLVKSGSKVFGSRDEYQTDQINLPVFKSYELTALFPGAEPLVIEVWDYDELFGDDLVGSTEIDLDDRWFSDDWRRLRQKPIEKRELNHPTSSLSQGNILCWLNIYPQEKAKLSYNRDWDITPEPSLDFEIRLSVMEVVNVPFMDIEGASDVFVKAYVDGYQE